MVNEDPVDVWFDDISIDHIQSPIAQQTDYYPFGLEIAATQYNRDAWFENNYLANGGSEKFDDLGVYETLYRVMDPALGRWWQNDPESERFAFATLYNVNFNSPTELTDPNGDCPEGVDCWDVNPNWSNPNGGLAGIPNSATVYGEGNGDRGVATAFTGFDVNGKRYLYQWDAEKQAYIEYQTGKEFDAAFFIDAYNAIRKKNASYYSLSRKETYDPIIEKYETEGLVGVGKDVAGGVVDGVKSIPDDFVDFYNSDEKFARLLMFSAESNPITSAGYYRGALMKSLTVKRLVLGLDPATLINARRLKPEFGVYQLLAHGDFDNFIVNGLRISPKQMAKTMLDNGFKKGMPIRCISCSTGAYLDGAAYRLGKALDSPVLAPTRVVATMPNGDYVIGNGGFWREFKN